jgi:hypothetical protein
MRDSAHAEKSHSSVLGMMATRGAGEEETPATVVREVWPGLYRRGRRGAPRRDKGLQPCLCAPRLVS